MTIEDYLKPIRQQIAERASNGCQSIVYNITGPYADDMVIRLRGLGYQVDRHTRHDVHDRWDYITVSWK